MVLANQNMYFCEIMTYGVVLKSIVLFVYSNGSNSCDLLISCNMNTLYMHGHVVINCCAKHVTRNRTTALY